MRDVYYALYTYEAIQAGTPWDIGTIGNTQKTSNLVPAIDNDLYYMK